MNNYQTAVELVGEYGIPVFPCNPDKSPRTTNGFKDASLDLELVDRWFLNSDSLVGIPTGKRSGLFVLDIDPDGTDWYREHAAELRCGRVQKTRRGWHLIYRMPDADIGIGTGLVPGVDWRGNRGYIIAWQSEGLPATGELTDLVEPPGWLIELVEAKTRGAKPAGVNDRGDHVVEGGRNAHLASLAGKLRRPGFSPREVLATLLQANQDRCTPPLPEAEVRLIAQSIAKYPPGDDAEPPPIDFANITVPSMGELIATKVIPRTWFFDQIMPAGAFLIVGRPKVGKSWLLLQAALAAARGDSLLGYASVGATGVLYVAAEDDAARIQERFAIIGQGPPPSGLRVMVSDNFRALAAQYGHVPLAEFFGNYLAAHPDIKLLVMDTEATCRAIWDGEGGRAKDIKARDYGETREFDVVALRERAFIGLVNHASKRKSGGYIDLHELVNRTNVALAGASGSIVLADPPSAHVEDSGDEQSKVRLLGFRGRDLRDDVLIAVKQGEDASFTNLGNWSTFSATTVEQELWEAALTIHKASPGFIKARDLADAVGKQPGTVQRAVSRMLKAGRHTWQGYRLETTPSKGFKLVSAYGELP